MFLIKFLQRERGMESFFFPVGSDNQHQKYTPTVLLGNKYQKLIIHFNHTLYALLKDTMFNIVLGSF